MTHEQILTKAIDKAKGNGFNLLKKYGIDTRSGWRVDLHKEVQEPYIKEYKGEIYVRELPYQVLIFNHDFARALWGDGDYEYQYKTLEGVSPITGNPIIGPIPAWQYHLQQMVIADDPIAYLGRNL